MRHFIHAISFLFILFTSACTSHVSIDPYGSFISSADTIIISGVRVNPSTRIDNGPIVSRQFSFNASSYHFSTSANIRFINAGGRNNRGIIRGPSRVVNAIEVENFSGDLSIFDPSSSWVVRRPIEVTLFIPLNSPLNIISSGSSHISIPSTQASLSLSVSGSGSVRFGHASSTNITIVGSGHVVGQSVSQSLDVSITGSADVRVQDAKLNNLDAEIEGSGSLQVGGYAGGATLQVIGSGSIYVNHVTAQPRTQSIGSGSIKIGNWQ